MDHSSSADLMLLCFKVIAKLVTLAKLHMGQLLKENQLLDLINFCISCKIPWAPFALACFLQDVLDLASNKSEETEMETENPTPISWSQNDSTETDSIANSFNIDEVMSIGAALIKPPKSNSMVNNNSFPPLPSVYESEDSDFDDFLADIRADKFRCLSSKGSRSGAAGATGGASAAAHSSLSCAMDSRLELGVQAASEITLKKLVVKHTKELLQNVTAEQSQAETTTQLNPWPTPVEVMPDESSLSNHKILTYCFASLFENLQNQEPSKIEHVLQLWLTLNCPASGSGNSATTREHFAPGCIPQIVLNCSSVNYLISAFAWTPGLSITTWCLALQTLTLVCNVTNGKKWFDLSGMANTIVNHPDFVQMFLNLLSGTGPVFNGKVLAGPSLCKALHDFLVRLQMRCDIVSSSSKLGNLLKTLLLKVIYQLAQPSGSIASMLGPLDAQSKLLQTMSYLDFTNTDLSIAMSTLESTASLVHNYVLNREKVKCISIGEKQSLSSNAFSEIFASVLGSDSNKQDRPVSYEDLLILMLKLMGKLVHTPLPDQTDAMETEPTPPVTSQTDESKAAEQQQQQQQENSSAPPARQQPCFADVVLQHRPTVVRLCRCLAACKSSSLCMLANVSQKVAFSNLSEPNTVADAVFHLLALLARKASRKELLLEPLLAFLAQTPQLSEPLLWFVQQVVLDSEETVKKFFDAGGVTILSNSVISSSSSPSTLPRTGTIAAVMQHFSGGGGAVSGGGSAVSGSSACVGAAADAASGVGFVTVMSSGIVESSVVGGGSSAGGGGGFACQAPAASKKMMQASIEHKMALVNFAPYCTITCESNTAQPADVLIQGLVTHRRARTPLWSYHFYPEEVHTELILQLPSAILLREVQLQPHAGGLATCPSYVAMEVSANGPSRLVPACLPLPTSGLTYIRMHLPVPKVVNCVLIRLYRPHDANGIGLLQIRLLGNYAFGGSLTQNADTDDEAHCKHSLGWLRLLHHCFTAVTATELRRDIIDAASNVPQLLTTCCGLLLVPSHILPVYLPCLEKVLRELALHSPENGFQTIKVLLDSRSGVMEPLVAFDGNWQDRLVNVTGYQSACELLYQICEHQDANTYQRVKMILDWLETSAAKALETGNTDNCNAAYVSTIASILWSAKETNVQYDLKALVTTELFESVYSLKVKAEKNMSLKYALDSLLCAMCYIRPELFSLLLQKVGVLVANFSTDHEASISDDRKDSEGMTDDSKGGVFEMNSEWYGHLSIGDLATLNLTREQLETIALVSRSPTAIKQLLDSGLPKLLNSAIFEFCRSENGISTVPMAKLENVTSILQFFSDVCDEKTMRDWLGSEEGSSFWLHLLQWLCKKPAMKALHLQSEAHVQLEEVCVKFLSKCCLCHPTNQARLAKVLCDVIYLQANGNGISGFMRRLILQLLLENEKIPVSVEADETLYKNSKLSHAYVPAHPSFKQTYNRAMLYLNTNTTLLEILDQHVFFRTSYKSDSLLSKKSAAAKKDVFKNWFYEDSDLSMAAGVTAKDKRAKDAKNQSSQAAAAAAAAGTTPATTAPTPGVATTPQSKKKRYAPETASGVGAGAATATVGAEVEGMRVKCDAYAADQPLPLTINLGQLLRLIESKGTTTNWPYVHIKIYNSKMSDDKTTEVNSALLQQQPVCSALQVFSSMGGLALLAQHLPTIYSEAVKSTGVEKTSSDLSDSDWIKVEECDDIYEDISEEMVGGCTSPSKTSGLVSHVPPHSLTAFGLFLRLPGYAEVLLKDMKKALCLLRLVLGVTDDGEGGDIFHSPLADSLPTLPFEVLKRLYDATPLSTDDGRLLRRISVNVGVVHLLLACLGVFTHHQANGAASGGPGGGGGQGGGSQPTDKDGKGAANVGGKEDKSQLYWAKGTGFGTGSTQQSWNVEQALLKQRNEEEHVTVLLQVLASYINPNDEADEELNGDVLPTNFHELLAQSALLPAISSYLRNDSVLDMARHIPLYKAVLQLLRALAVSSQLVSLLLPQEGSNEPSVTLLLRNMKSCVDTYASKLRLNTKTKVKSKLGEQLEEMEQGEGLATLMPDIQNTANLVSKVTSGMVESDSIFDSSSLIDKKTVTSMEEYYIKVMKNLQFSSYEMITELPEGTIKFVISHHFESNVLTTGEQSHPTRVKRIAQEAVTLSTSLPLSYSSSVFVRYDTSRLDVMKVLITGPAETPYANGCFELDVFFPADYPLSPMLINLETTGRHTVRFNPNLYNDGKVCLSVLNTWHGRPEEKWNAQTSSFLQVLVSIQSLILVPEPYFNEPGYERARGTPAGTVSSRDYNLNVCQATVRWAMLEQILNPCPCFKEVIHTHFYLKRHEVIAQVGAWVEEVEKEVAKEKKSTRSTKKSPTTTLENFKKVYQQLKEALLKLKPPAFLEQEDEDEEASTPTNNMEVSMTEVQQSEKDKDLEKMVNEMCD
nr:unnamed protein product [Callosobruchus chinensis]